MRQPSRGQLRAALAGPDRYGQPVQLVRACGDGRLDWGGGPGRSRDGGGQDCGWAFDDGPLRCRRGVLS